MTVKPKRKPPKHKLDDEAFLRRLAELGENKSALGREIGLTPSGVFMRLRRIDPDGKRLEAAKASGRAAVLVHQAVGDVGFEAGANNAARHLKQVDNLSKYCGVIDQILNQLLEEMAAHTGNSKPKLKPYQVSMVCQLIAQGRNLAETIHRIYAGLYDTKGAMAYFETVTRILKDAIPDARERIYRELLKLGREEQAEVLYSTDEIPKVHKEGGTGEG